MDLPDDPRLKNLISSCGGSTVRSQDFIRHLGLPLTIEKKGARGYPKFDDETGQVEKLYRATLKMLNTLFESHDTVEELRNVAMSPCASLLKDVTADMLSTYGQVVWNGCEPRLTRINDDYPRFLIYTDPEDYQRIRAYLYYWILHRAIRKYDGSTKIPKSNKSPTKTTKSKFAKKTHPPKSRPSIMYVSSDLEESEDDSSSESEWLDSGGAEHRSNSSNVRSNLSPQVPVAPMLPGSARIGPTRMTDFPIARPPFTRPQVIPSESIQGSTEVGTSRSVRKIKRRNVSSPDEPAPQESASRKRKSPPLNEELSIATKTPRKNGTSDPHLDTEREPSNGRLSYPSPQESSHVEESEEVLCNFPTISRALGNDGSKEGRDTAHSSERTLEDNAGEQDSDLSRSDNGEGVAHGCSDATQLSSGTNLQGKHSSLIVILKLSDKGATEGIATQTPSTPTPAAQAPSRTEQSRYHRRLASMLLDLLDTCDPEHQDLTALEETTTLINKMRDDEGLWFQKTDRRASDKHQTILLQWLQCVDAFTKFRKVTGFKGDKSKRAAFVKGLAPEMKKAARGPLVRMSSAISDWRQEPGFTVAKFSKDLAHVLFEMTTWMDMMELEELEEDLTKFNERLLAWFD